MLGSLVKFLDLFLSPFDLSSLITSITIFTYLLFCLLSVGVFYFCSRFDSHQRTFPVTKWLKPLSSSLFLSLPHVLVISFIFLLQAYV